MYGVQKQQLRNLTKKEYLATKTMCHLAKNMVNVGLYNVRQHFFKEKKYLNYYENNKISKANENYKLLNAGVAQQILMKVDENFKSFFGLRKIGAKARIPNYLPKDSYFELTFPQIKLQKDGSFFLPMSPAFKREYGKVNIKVPSNLVDKKIKEVRLSPRYDGRFFEIEYVYQVEEVKPKLLKKNMMSIDLGIDNFASVLTTTGASYLLDGKTIKSVNQWYNKRNSQLQAIKDKHGLKVLTKKQMSLIDYRNHYINDYMNKVVHFLVNNCLENKIGRVVVGYNKGWKKESSIGKVNNQKFTSIPHGKFVKKLKAMCERFGIAFYEQEESYTSKASFLDKDVVPTYEKGEKTKQTFSGKRVRRGLYRSADGTLVNADINGAANILKKSGFRYNFKKICDIVKQNPTKIRISETRKPKANTDLWASA